MQAKKNICNSHQVHNGYLTNLYSSPHHVKAVKLSHQRHYDEQETKNQYKFFVKKKNKSLWKQASKNQDIHR
jgi:hypothetical protein